MTKYTSPEKVMKGKNEGSKYNRKSLTDILIFYFEKKKKL